MRSGARRRCELLLGARPFVPAVGRESAREIEPLVCTTAYERRQVPLRPSFMISKRSKGERSAFGKIGLHFSGDLGRTVP